LLQPTRIARNYIHTFSILHHELCTRPRGEARTHTGHTPKLCRQPGSQGGRMRTADRNRATAYLMRSNGMISGDVESILALYLRQCSVRVTCTDLAVMAATLANGGVNPLTGERASPPSRQRSVERAARLRHVRRGRSVGLRRGRPRQERRQRGHTGSNEVRGP